MFSVRECACALCLCVYVFGPVPDYVLMCVCVCVCICLCVDVALSFSLCVSVSSKFVRSACVCPFVSISAYIGAMLCLSGCCVCLHGCTFGVSIIFPSRVFGCLNVSFYLPDYARQYLCFRLLISLPSSTDPGEDRLWKKNCREAGTSASVDQKLSGRGLTSYNRKTPVHKQCSRGCSERSGSKPAIQNWKTI